ncbi:MAG: AI-2E family transporter [Bacteroidales bacterium]|nr:AI-2E family transporter [Bacteroidales bacterium]
MKKIRTTNILLLIIVIFLVFYILKLLSFIFIPLVLSMFIALLFLPLMRWLNKKRIPNVINISIVILIIAGVLKLGGELIQLSSREIVAIDNDFFAKAETKLVNLITSIESFFGVERLSEENVLVHYAQKTTLLKNFGSTIDFISDTVSMTLMTVFFTILLLSGSLNVQKLMNSTIFKQKYSSVKTFMQIEKDIIKFVIVKFIISLLTGISFSLACLFFDISFPIFWGVFAVLINFVQMVGSVISVVVLSLFAFIDIDPTGTLLFFIITITAIQALFGGVLEPVFMGKTFSVNVIVVLIMLMLWGYIWGVPGLIMSIPITVFIKIILEQFPKTKIIAHFMSGSDPKINLLLKNKK